MTATLTSRERVRRFLAREIPDRVPVDYAANPGIDRRLKQHFGLGEHDDEGLRRALGVDFRAVGAPYTGPRLHPELPGLWVDPNYGFRSRWIEHGSGRYCDFCDWPLAEADLDAVAAWPLPDPDLYDYAAAARQAEALDGFGLYIGNPGCGDVLNSTGMLMGMARVYAALAEDDPAWRLLAERKVAHDVAVTERTLAACRGRIDMLWIGEDLGSQRGPLCSLASFRRILRPFHERVVAAAKAHGIPVMLHSCGASRFVFDELADMGISAIDTLQPDAAGMAAEELKPRYGGRLAFHGGITTGGIIAKGTAEEAAAEARRVLGAMMPGGGYAFSPAHALQDDTPTGNVLAIYAAAHEHGRYP